MTRHGRARVFAAGAACGFSFPRTFRSLRPVTAARTLPISCLLILVAGAAAADDAPEGRVSVAAEAPVINLPLAPPGRHTVDLPSLTYAFEISAQCTGDGVPESLSINVADTHVTLSAGELAEPGPRRLVLEVPASQTAPLALGEFCTAETPAPGGAPEAPGTSLLAPGQARPPTRLDVPGALSAQVSLVCRHGEARRMSWFSQPLGVTLACESAAPQGSAPSPPAR